MSDDEKATVAREALIDEQKADPSLKSCWSLMQHGKGKFCYQDDILMRREKLLGQNFTQLVLPQSRCEKVFEFGHKYAGHVSPKKKLQRIKLNFWWPSIKRDVCHCEICQLRARKTCWDRVPIQATVRQEIPSSHWYCDVAGPMSSEKIDFPYSVLLLDSMTRYPAAIAIRSPTVKNICDCLIKHWVYFGITRYVTLDNATCNVAKLTQELMKRFGVSPRFITLYHSQANAAERLIAQQKTSLPR